MLGVQGHYRYYMCGEVTILTESALVSKSNYWYVRLCGGGEDWIRKVSAGEVSHPTMQGIREARDYGTEDLPWALDLPG